MPCPSRPLALLLAAACSGCGRDGGEGDGGAAPEPWFVDSTRALGIEFELTRPVPGDYFMPDSMGPGCALFDADGDGDLDLYLVCAFRDAERNLVTSEGANRLFLQEPDGRFRDATAGSGAGHEGYGMGVAVGDADGDGDSDLYVTNYGPDVLLLNDGAGHFSDGTAAAGIANEEWGASAGFFDPDADGDLDLYVTNYLALDEGQPGMSAAGEPEYPAPLMFPGVADKLFENLGGGRFRDASAASGIGAVKRRGLGCVFTDLDGDGRIDVFVANDAEPNLAWIQTAEGRFEDRAERMGLAVNAFGRSEASMGVALGDGDGDGDVDLVCTHLVRETNTFYRQTAPGRFADDTFATGLGAPSGERTAFGIAFLDVDLDGDLDLLVANGRVLRGTPEPGARLGPHWDPYAEPNQLFLNDGAGRFALGAACGAPCSDVEVSRGLAVGDLDGDGDLDAVVANGNGTVRVYENRAPRAGGWLVVRAVDAAGRVVHGAVVEVEAAGRRFSRELTPVQSYLSSSEAAAHFGLGDAREIDAVHVRWPDGGHESFAGGPVDRVRVLTRGGGR